MREFLRYQKHQPKGAQPQSQRFHRAPPRPLHPTTGTRRMALSPPPPQCCSTSSGASALSQPISLDLATYEHQTPLLHDKDNHQRWVAPVCSPPWRPHRRFPRAHSGEMAPFLVGTGHSQRQKQLQRRPPPHPQKDIVLDLDALGDTSEGEEQVEGGHPLNGRHHRHHYSTSDLTTSDSELGKMARGKPFLLGAKFPFEQSLSTINPDDSSLSFDDFELDKRQPLARMPRHPQQHFFISPDASDDDFDGTAAGSEPEMREMHALGEQQRRRRHHHHRLGALPPPPSATQSAPRTPQKQPRPPALEMIEEISPVLPPPLECAKDELDVPPLPMPLQMSKEWRPLQTSTMTNFHATLPKTNPRHQRAAMEHHHANLPQLAPLEPPRSLFDPLYRGPLACCAGIDFLAHTARPENYNLPSALAKSVGIRGILFIQLSVSSDAVLRVHVKNGAYFLKEAPSTSFVKVEIRRAVSNRKRTKYDKRFVSQCSQQPLSAHSNFPEFYESFCFRISRVHLKFGDKLGISVFARAGEDKTPELLGGMSFSLRKLIKTAKMHTSIDDLSSHRHRPLFHLYDFGDDANHQRHQQKQQQMAAECVKVAEGGYFLLPDRKALETHLSQDNILHRKYYDEIGGSTMSTNTTNSSFGSPFKMMSEPEWSSARHHAAAALGTRFGAKPPPTLNFGAKEAAAKGPNGNKEQHNGTEAADSSHYTTSNNSSSSQSGIEYKRSRPINGLISVSTKQGARPMPAATMANAKMAQLGIPPTAAANTTDTTTSDFTSSGFTSSSGASAPQQMGNAIGDSFSSVGADVCAPEAISLAFVPEPRNAYTMEKGREHRGGPSAATMRAKSEQPPASGERKETPPKGQGVPSCSSASSLTVSNAGTAAAAADSVRRVASFTFSPPGAGASLGAPPGAPAHFRLSKRNSVSVAGRHGALTDKLARKQHAFGPLGRTLNFLKSKLDFTMSASALCPTREECRLWQESFEALLSHKYGCLLFREFLQSEFSEENLEFWLECEEYKQMKPAKKPTEQKARRIYATYVCELAPKEINLDSQTRLATKAALEDVPLRMDMFNLAQSKIEQLMAKDSYPRFLKSEPYLELLNGSADEEEGGGASTADGKKRLLRVSSAKEAGRSVKAASAGATTTGSRSPSLSPKLNGWNPARRNTTCSPATGATLLQIPSIAE